MTLIDLKSDTVTRPTDKMSVRFLCQRGSRQGIFRGQKPGPAMGDNFNKPGIIALPPNLREPYRSYTFRWNRYVPGYVRPGQRFLTDPWHNWWQRPPAGTPWIYIWGRESPGHLVPP